MRTTWARATMHTTPRTCTHTRMHAHGPPCMNLCGHTRACVHTYTDSRADAWAGNDPVCTLVPPHLFTAPLEVIGSSHVSIW